MGGLAGPGEKFGLYFKGCGKPLVGLKLKALLSLNLNTHIYEQLIIL